MFSTELPGSPVVCPELAAVVTRQLAVFRARPEVAPVVLKQPGEAIAVYALRLAFIK